MNKYKDQLKSEEEKNSLNYEGDFLTTLNKGKKIIYIMSILA